MSGCFERALRAAGVDIPEDLQIPFGTTKEDHARICDILGLQYIRGWGTVTADLDAKLIAIVVVGPGTGHAVYTRGWKLAALEDELDSLVVVEGDVIFVSDPVDQSEEE